MKTVEETGDFCAGANLSGLTLSQWCIDSCLRKKNSAAQEKTALFNSLEVGSFKSFSVVDLGLSGNPDSKGCVSELGDAVEKHVTIPRCPSHPHHSSSHRLHPPHHHRRSSSRKKGQSLHLEQGLVCGRSTLPAWWAPSRRLAQLPPLWPILVFCERYYIISHDWHLAKRLFKLDRISYEKFLIDNKVRLYLMISTYSRSLPLLSLHLRYMTEASTFAGEKVFGSFSSEITLSKMVLEAHTNMRLCWYLV